MEDLVYKVILSYAITGGAILLILELFNTSTPCMVGILLLLIMELLIIGRALYKHTQNKGKEFNETETKN